MTEYYRVGFDAGDLFGAAFGPADGNIFVLPQSGLVRQWVVPDLELRDGDLPDYLSSDMGCRLCSERLREFLSNQAAPEDCLQWLEVNVARDWDVRPYFVLHFPDPSDVLDPIRTIFADDFVVKPVLSAAKVGRHRVFNYPTGVNLPLFLHADVKHGMDHERFTGLVTTKLPVV